jgi:hypothetical protein
MLDLSDFAQRLDPRDPRLHPAGGAPPPPAASTRRGVRWWLVREDIDPDEVLARLLASLQAGGWRRVAQEKLRFVVAGPRDKLLVCIEDDPCRLVRRRTLGGEEHEAPLWPDTFDGRVIISVEVL